MKKQITHPKIIHQNGFLRTSTSKLVRLSEWKQVKCYVAMQKQILARFFVIFVIKHHAKIRAEKK